MTNMNHADAIRLGACEKYLLGELADPLRDEFEEHYFQCAECARDVQSASVFVTAGREALQESSAALRAREAATVSGWFRWLRPAFALPAFAALLLVLGYETLIAVPHWRHLAAQATSPVLLNPILLHPGIARGIAPSISVTPGRSFAVYLDIPTEPAYPSYLVRLQNSADATRDLLNLSSAEIQKPPLLTMPADLSAGAYTIQVLGSSQAGGAPASQVASFSFAVEIPANSEQH